MREGWKEFRIDELGKGLRPVLKAGPFGSALTKAIYEVSGYKVYGQQEVVAKDINAEAYFVSDVTFLRHKGCAVEPGDILMTMMGTIGRVYRVPQDAPKGIINPRLVRISFDKSRVLPEFAEAALEQPPLQRLLDRRSHGGTMQGLNLDALASIRLSVPPLPEQRKIAEILRTWDEALEKLTALRAAKARRLAGVGRALLDRAAKNPATKTKPLATLARIVKGQQLNKLDILDGEYPVWNGGTNPSGFHNEWNTEGRSITISEGGNSCGFVNLADRPFWLGGHCYALRGLSKLIDRDFLFHQLKAREPEIMRLRVGSGLPNIQRGDLERLLVVVPPRDLQEKIACALTAGNAELTFLEAEIEALTRQKRGLMQKLLTGEWRVAV